MDIKIATLKKDGFVGCLYSPKITASKAVIVMTGSDGGLDNAKYISELFSLKGFAALALAYFKYPELNKYLDRIPLEYIENAINWLKEHTDLEKVALYGVSKGAEYALVASTYFSDIDSLVAVVPNYYIAEGIGRAKSRTGNSSWTYNGKPLPFARIPGNSFSMLKTFILERQMKIIEFYELAEKAGIPDNALIPIEKSNARILLLSSGKDNIWPSKKAGDILINRLQRANYPFEFRHESFENSSHILNPVHPGKAKKLRFLIRIERQYPDECQNARDRAFKYSVNWIDGLNK